VKVNFGEEFGFRCVCWALHEFRGGFIVVVAGVGVVVWTVCGYWVCLFDWRLQVF